MNQKAKLEKVHSEEKVALEKHYAQVAIDTELKRKEQEKAKLNEIEWKAKGCFFDLGSCLTPSGSN